MQEQILIYSQIIGSRLKYLVHFLSNPFVQVKFLITSNIEEYKNFKGPKINYSLNKICSTELKITPHTLLFQQNIVSQKITVEYEKNVPIFFLNNDLLGFDLFSAIFFLLSRYEEYLPHKLDEYGRYAHSQSLAFTHHFLNRPLINEWLDLFRKELMILFPEMQFKKKTFSFIPTYDIDEAWSFLNKNWVRLIGASAKNIWQGKFKILKDRVETLSGQKIDEYYSFEWINLINTTKSLQPVYFILLPQKNTKYDKNILPSHKKFQKLIQQLAVKYTLGIHPSWQSGDDKKLILSEKNELEKICNFEIVNSRQHFIRLSLPHTYQYLIDAGIKHDYSMGYGSINGFRASVATDFYWYDLVNEKETELNIHPFCFMDANSYFEQKQNTHETTLELTDYLLKIKKVNGQMITIWHNTFLGSAKRFLGWKEIYKNFINQATS